MMLARFVAAAALLLAAAPASATVLGTAQLRIDGAVVFTAASPAAVSSSLAPASGAANPFSGVGYGYIAEMTGTLSAVSTLPPSTPAIYEASGAATLGTETLAAFGPTDYGVLRLDEVLADPSFPSILADLAAGPVSGFESYSLPSDPADPLDRFDGFFSYAVTPGAGALSGVFNGFVGFDQPILGIAAAVDLAGIVDPLLGEEVNALLSDLFTRSLTKPSPSEPFTVRIDVVASVVPVPLAAPMLIAALGAAAVASRRRRAAPGI